MSEGPHPLRLLSLDGGGIRGYSTILLLKAIFQQLEDIQGHPSLPYEVFDIIAGTSTGGLIATMLGPLRMSVEDCRKTYLDMAPQVFPIESRIKRSTVAKLCGLARGKARFNARPLETFLKNTISEHVVGRSQAGANTNLRFEAGKKSPRCKIFMCSMSKNERVA
jgi:patatin-like phospholipase/acyl hydrolase